MTAILNILKDLFFQLRLHGDLTARLSCVAVYYLWYIHGRMLGLSQGDSRLHSLKALARRGIPAKIVEIRCQRKIRMSLDVFSSCFEAKEILHCRMYEHLPRFRPHPAQTVVDVGAHQGIYSLYAASLVGKQGKIIAIEPLPRNIALLKKNVATNSFSQVIPLEVAVSETAGTASFYIFDVVTGGSLVMNPEGSTVATIRTDTLDNILASLNLSRVDIIKIDVEGACLKVLAGAQRTLTCKPLLVMEVEGGDDEIKKAIQYLEKLRYGAKIFGSILYAEPHNEANR